MENIIEQVKDLSVADLDNLINELKKLAESKRPTGIAKWKSYGYNPRRHSKPWIAKVVSWPACGRPDIEFGTFYGNAEEGGTAEITAREGDIIRWGQKDNRGNGTINCWGVFRNGEVIEITQTEARELYCGD